MTETTADVARTTPTNVRVRPKRTLLVSGVLSFALVSVPLFTALYLLGIPIGTGPIILGIQALSLVLSLICLTRYLMSFDAVEDDALVYRAFTSPLIRVPLSRIETIVLVETYRWNAPDSVPQLLLLDADGRRVDRMRGTFWREKDMRAIAAAVGRPISQFPEPVTMHEFFATYPTARYWFENRLVAAVGGGIAFVAALATVPWLMSLVGMPLFSG